MYDSLENMTNEIEQNRTEMNIVKQIVDMLANYEYKS